MYIFLEINFYCTIIVPIYKSENTMNTNMELNI